MKFHCERCKTKYSIGDERVRGKILKIRCKNCSNIVTVRDDEAFAKAAGGAAGAKAPALERALNQAMQPGARTESPPESAQIDEAWYLAVGQQQFGPIAFRNLIERIEKGEATGDSYVWREGLDDWVRAESVPELRPHLRKRRASIPSMPAIPAIPAAATRKLATTRPPGAADIARITPVAPVAPSPQPRPSSSLFPTASTGNAATGAASSAPQSAAPSAPSEAALEFNIDEPSRIVRLDALFPTTKGSSTNEQGAGKVFTLPGLSGAAAGKEPDTVTDAKPAGDAPSIFAPTQSDRRAVHHYRLLSVVLGTVVLALVIVVVSLWSHSMTSRTVVIEKEKSPEDVGAEIADQLVREAARKKLEQSGLAGEADNVPPARTLPPRRATRAGAHKEGRPTIAHANGTGNPGDRLGDLYSDTSKAGAALHGPDRPQEDAVGMFKRGAKLCYERALKKDPSMAQATKVDVNVTTGSGGGVSAIDISQPYRNQFLGQCLSVMIRRLPWPAEGRVWQFPLVFRGS